MMRNVLHLFIGLLLIEACQANAQQHTVLTNDQQFTGSRALTGVYQGGTYRQCTLDSCTVIAGSTPQTFGTASNSSDTFNATIPATLSSYMNGYSFDLLITSPNTTSGAVMNLNGLGLKNVRRIDGNRVLPGAIVNGISRFIYDQSTDTIKCLSCGTSQRLLNLQLNTVSNPASTTETDAHSYTLPANSLDYTGKAILVKAVFTAVGSTDSKDFRIYFGGTQTFEGRFIGTQASRAILWFWIYKTGASTQKVSTYWLISSDAAQISANSKMDLKTTAITDTSDQVIKTTIQEVTAGTPAQIAAQSFEVWELN